MSGHTPGPWFGQEGFLTIYNLSQGDSGLTCAIAKVLEDQPGREAANANARLIAAAPDLLAALVAMRDQFAYTSINDGDDEANEQARNAIAKAQGARRE